MAWFAGFKSLEPEPTGGALHYRVEDAKVRLPRLAIQVGVLGLSFTMIGCQTGKDQGNTPSPPTIEGAAGMQTPAQQMPGALGGSERIMSDMKAAGFSVADPSVQWGVTVVVDAEHITGGFSADIDDGGITLHWNKIQGADSYEIFRSPEPAMPLLMQTTLTMDAGGNAVDAQVNHWLDNKVAANTLYYYAILAMMKNGSGVLAATGYARSTDFDARQSRFGAGGAPLTGEPLARFMSVCEKAKSGIIWRHGKESIPK